jgi:hypothetical protein
MKEKRKPVKTVLDGPRELTNEEKQALAKEWAEHTLVDLLAYTDSDLVFAESLCITIANRFGPDDRLSAILKNNLLVERQGKKAGRHTKWDASRYRHLIMVYNIQINQGTSRETVLGRLADMEKISCKSIEKRITAAKKIISNSDLPTPFQRPPFSNNKGSVKIT